MTEHGVLGDDITVVHGAQIYGDDPGSGPIAPSKPIVIDLAPRDPDSTCFADMTHTFVGGEIEEEIAAHRRLVREALTRAREVISAGLPAQAPYDVVCVWLESEGDDIERTKQPGTFSQYGFFYGLGHGVGSTYTSGRYPHRSTVFMGDVVMLEPKLYRDGYRGCRLETWYWSTRAALSC